MSEPEALEGYRSAWQHKPVLQLIYDDFSERIAAACVPGLTVEIGGGIGNLKQRLSNVVATDVQFAPWLDCVADAQRLPFADGIASNIVMVDVLHHIEYPPKFFRDAARVLRPGGRIVMVEPARSRWAARLFYRVLHHEPVRTSADPLADGVPDPGARSLRFQPGHSDPDRDAPPRSVPSDVSGLAYCADRLVFLCGLSAQRRLQALEPGLECRWPGACWAWNESSRPRSGGWRRSG